MGGDSAIKAILKIIILRKKSMTRHNFSALPHVSVDSRLSTINFSLSDPLVNQIFMSMCFSN